MKDFPECVWHTTGMTPLRTLVLSGFFLLTLPLSTVHAATTASSVTASVTPLFGTSTVPQGAQRVGLASVRLQVPCIEDVSVTSITLKRSGLGASSDFLRVYAMQGTTRKSRGVILRNKETSTRVPLRSLGIKKCGSVDLTVYADMARDAAAGSQHSFEVTEVETSAGNAMITQSSVKRSALQVTPSSSNDASISAEFRPVLGDIYYGQSVVIARLLLKNTGTSDLNVNSVLFTNQGSASDADLQNLSLESSRGDTLSKILPQMDSDTALIEFDPAFILERGEEKLLQLRADVRASRKKTIRWSIEEPSDIQAIKASRRR